MGQTEDGGRRTEDGRARVGEDKRRIRAISAGRARRVISNRSGASVMAAVAARVWTRNRDTKRPAEGGLGRSQHGAAAGDRGRWDGRKSEGCAMRKGPRSRQEGAVSDKEDGSECDEECEEEGERGRRDTQDVDWAGTCECKAHVLAGDWGLMGTPAGTGTGGTIWHRPPLTRMRALDACSAVPRSAQVEGDSRDRRRYQGAVWAGVSKDESRKQGASESA